jgi:hypothetical protein
MISEEFCLFKLFFYKVCVKNVCAQFMRNLENLQEKKVCAQYANAQAQ